MTVVRLDCDRINDWDSFHAVFAEVFGFPGFYGRNMNAWIDCMSYLDDPASGMSQVSIPTGGVLTIQLDGVDEFAARCPEQYSALIECAAFVNWRRSSEGEGAVLALAFCKGA
jgi:Barstar (barnase inhibitor)